MHPKQVLRLETINEAGEVKPRQAIAYPLLLRHIPAGVVPLLLATLIVACGSNSTAVGSSPTGSPTAANCIAIAAGTLQSFTGATMSITGVQGKQVQATYTVKTLFLREITETKAALQEGVRVSVRVTQNADNSYSALQITLRNGTTGTSPTGTGQPLRSRSQTGGLKACSSNARVNAGFGQGASQSRQTINGTVGQLNGNTLTVTDTSGADYTIGLISTTQITSEKVASPTDLQNGEAVTVTGSSSSSQGVIAANTVIILLRLPRANNG